MEVARVPNPQIYCKLKRILDTRSPGVGPTSTPLGFDASMLLNNSRVVPFSIRLINDVIWNDNGIEKMQMLDSPIKVLPEVTVLQMCLSCVCRSVTKMLRLFSVDPQG